LRAFSPDLFIVNFEPLAPLLARSLGVPFISFSNQHALLFVRQPVPAKFRSSALVTKTAARVVAAGADAYVVMSFLRDHRHRDNVRVVPPVLQEEFRQLKSEIGGYVLVYLKERNPALLRILRQINEHFVVYGYDVDATEGNLTFRTFGRGMPRELAGCKAAIGTSGLSFITEALWLKKPFFGVPLKGEFEQTANALFIQEAGLGAFAERPAKEEVEGFLANLPAFRGALAEFRFDPDAAGKALLELADGGLAQARVPAAVALGA
jgi:uncharacterized protein (TIGR00661 family)